LQIGGNFRCLIFQNRAVVIDINIAYYDTGGKIGQWFIRDMVFLAILWKKLKSMEFILSRRLTTITVDLA